MKLLLLVSGVLSIISGIYVLRPRTPKIATEISNDKNKNAYRGVFIVGLDAVVMGIMLIVIALIVL